MNGILLFVTVTVFMGALLLMVGEPMAGPDLAQVIADAHAKNEKVPNPAACLPGLTYDQAYDIQSRVVALEADRRGGRAGFKAALTTEAAQKKFGAPGPTYGVLLKDMLLESGAVINTQDFGRLLIEVEIALIIGRDIEKPLADLAEARAAVEAAAPAIELPESRLADPASATALDLVADNANACRVILGSRMDLKSIGDINQIKIKLTKDGQTVNEGAATDSSGDQYKTLMWLSEVVTSRGGGIKKGQVIITGALGQMLPAALGQYHSDYGILGSLDFILK